MLFNRVDGKGHSQVLVYDDVVKKLTYGDKEAKGEIVKIYKKPQSLINYLIENPSFDTDSSFSMASIGLCVGFTDH